MPGHSFHEVSEATRNAVLSARLAKALTNYGSGTTDQKLIQNGVDLLTSIIQGALLVEKRASHQASGLSASHQGLQSFGHALSAVEKLDRVKENTDLAELFLSYREQLGSLSVGRPVDRDIQTELARLFRLLGSLFQEDLSRLQHDERQEPILSRHSPR